MTPQEGSAHKPNGERLTIRAVLLVLLAQYVAAADAVLLYAAHQAVPLIVVSAMAAFAAAYHFFDGVIEG